MGSARSVRESDAVATKDPTWIRRRRLGFREPRLHRAQLRDHPIAELPAAVEDVRRFLRITVEVVELGPRRVDDLVTPRAQRAEIAPAVVVQRVHRLGVGVQPQFPCAAGEQGGQRDAGDSRRRRDAEQLQRGGHHVHRPHRIGDAAPVHRAERRPHDERHVDDAVVDEEAVGGLAVVAEALAVIAHHQDDGAIVDAERFELRDHPRHLAVGERDFAVVGMPLVARRERLRRAVRRVRVVEVQPGEKGLAAARVQPGERLIDDVVGGALDGAERDPARLAEIELVVVGVEPLRDPPLGIEHVGADEPRRAIAAPFQDLRERDLLVAEEEAAVVAHPVLGREAAGEHARVHREGEGSHCDRVLEEDPFPREPIERGRLDAGVAVRAHAVRPRRVKRDDDEVQRPAARPPRQGAEIHARAGAHRSRHQPPGGESARARQEQDDRGCGHPPGFVHDGQSSHGMMDRSRWRRRAVRIRRIRR